MKNATQLHEREIIAFLTDMGCSSIRLENGSIVALRPGREGRLYPLSIDLYEDATQSANSSLRFRVRAARRFGLPVTSHHGDSIHSALNAVQWRTLDRPAVTASAPLFAGVM